jgi:hypothetical protein
MPMQNRRISTTEWKVRAITQAAAAAGLGVGALFFEFQNMESGKVHPFVFIGGGGGLGVKASAGSGKWSKLEVVKPMGFWDLNFAGGGIVLASGGYVGGFGLMYISAWDGVYGIDRLFDAVPVLGFEWGTGLNGSFFNGIWKSIVTI